MAFTDAVLSDAIDAAFEPTTTGPTSSSPAWELFKREEARPGYCIAGCDRRLMPPKRLLCGDKECRRLFHAIYRRGLRQRARELAGVAVRERCH